MDVVFVTSNAHKAREAQLILGAAVKVVNAELDEIQSLDVEEIARKKVIQAYYSVGKPVFVEDTGLYINGLDGFPGPLVKWMAKGLGYEGMCRAVDICDDRSAYAMTCIAMYNGKALNSFIGRIDGRIAQHPVGKGKFGWDPIFIPRGQDKTFAQMPVAKKNGISMRSIAMKKLGLFLLAKNKGNTYI